MTIHQARCFGCLVESKRFEVILHNQMKQYTIHLIMEYMSLQKDKNLCLLI